ncbi:hypothetical protein [Arthrobacter sunyaminii]|uniref:hypothetical protein n=1 Tax=Arthrobacter sunyaminii TaxID=2816859 RepID=UPI001A93C85D|nr:hypothetical protein [Arthrobacter sunyaminii]MBO0898332.1 hypothetical protein [Arthrobacter sunyaminii]
MKATADTLARIGWAWALWMSARLPGQLEGKAAWEWLRDGGPVDDVLVLVRQDVASWAAA